MKEMKLNTKNGKQCAIHDVIRCTFNDSINERKVVFYSDAPQSTINALEFNGEWCVVKEILLGWGYKVIEHPIVN